MTIIRVATLSVFVLGCSAAGGDATGTGTKTPGGADEHNGAANNLGGGSNGSNNIVDIGLGGAVDGLGPDDSAALYTDVEVLITSDNAYGFGYGDNERMANYFGGVENVNSDDIFDCPIGHGPEAYVVPAGDAAVGNFLYIIAWADAAYTQGVIAQFRREGGQPVYTGIGNWQVCATGQNYNPGSGGPSLDVVNAELVRCNDASSPSAGWVDFEGKENRKLQFGEENATDRHRAEPGNEFPVTCEIDEKARWMWYNWDSATLNWPTSGSPFIWPGGSNPDQQFLIFRLAASEIPPVIR